MASGEAGGDTGPSYVTDVRLGRDFRIDSLSHSTLDRSSRRPGGQQARTLDQEGLGLVAMASGGASGDTDDPGGNDGGMGYTIAQVVRGTSSGASAFVMAIVLIRVERNGRHR